MSKAATRQKTETKTAKASSNGRSKTSSKNSEELKKHITDTVDSKEAHAEYLKRKKSQLSQ